MAPTAGTQPSLSPRSRDLLSRLAAERGITLDALVQALLPAPDTPDSHVGLAVDGAGEVTVLRLDELRRSQVNARPDALELRDLPALEVVSCTGMGLRRLAVARAPRLRQLRCHANGLEALELSELPALAELDAYGSALPDLDLRSFPALRDLNLHTSKVARLLLPAGLERALLMDNDLAAIDVAGERLREVRVDGNRLERLDLSGCPALEVLQCTRNRLRAIDPSPCPRLRELWCGANAIGALDTDRNAALEWLSVEGNPLGRLDLRPTPRLVFLQCGECGLGALDLAAVPGLTRLECAGNSLRALDLAPVPRLVKLDCAGNPLAALDLHPATGLAEAKVPPIPPGKLLATELQKRRVPALRPLFGVRKPPRAVKQMDAYELHDRAAGWNHDDGVRPLTTIAKHPACDLGTALYLYWRSSPHRYLAFRTRKEVPEHERDLWDLVRAIEERALAGGYRTRLIPFDPRCDTTYALGGKDWTIDADAGPRVRAIPPALIEACRPAGST